MAQDKQHAWTLTPILSVAPVATKALSLGLGLVLAGQLLAFVPDP